MSNEELIQQFFLVNGKLAESTRGIFISTLRRLSEFVGGKDFHALTLADLSAFLKTLPSDATRSGNLQRVKRFLRWLYNDVYNDELPRDFERCSVRYKRAKVRPEDLLTPDETRRLIDACDCLRDKCFVTLLSSTGCRVSEIRCARVGDVQEKDGIVRIYVNGKTGAYYPFVKPEAVPILREWITHLSPASKDQPLFPPEHDHTKPMSYPTVRLLLAKAAKHANIAKRVHSHLFRHARVTELIRAVGKDKTRDIMHYSPNSTVLEAYNHCVDSDTVNAFLESIGSPPATPQQPQPLPNASYTHSLMLTRDWQAEIEKLKKQVDMMTDVAVRACKRIEELEATKH